MKKLSFFLMAMLFSVMSFAAEVTVKISDYATTNGWKDATQYKTLKMDDNVSITVAGSSNTGKYYTNGNNWRMYQNESPKITLTATNGNLLKTVKFTYAAEKTGILVDASKAQVKSGTVYTFADEVTTYTFGVGNTGTATNGQVRFTEITVVYDAPTPSDPDAVKYTVTAKVNDPAMGTVSGAGEIEEGKTATLTANANAGYKFVNWSNGSTDNPLKITVTENVEITANFEVIPTMTCAEAAAAAKGATVVLNPFDVVYVVKGAGYTYIKDDSGVNLIFDYTMDDQFKAGDHVEGFVGTSSPYNGLPEIKPTVSFADLKVTPGTAPEATVFETVPTKEDVNKYVVFKGVKLTSNISYTTSSATNATISVGGKNVTLRNNFKLAASLTSGSTYDIYAFVAIYNGNIQMYYASSVDVSPERTITATVNPAETGTVTGAGTYKEGKTATLKATPAEGYAFTCWTEGEDTVSTAANYSFKVAADRALVANFAKKTYNVTVTAENGTVAGAGEYEEGKEATLTATANEGYEFTCWTSGEDTVSTANPYTFAVTANVALVANFKEVVVEEPVEAKLYLTPNANWKQGNARFAAYFFGNGETWVGMTKVDGETDLYEVTIPTDKKYPNVIFCRMNPGAAANNWNNKWNQTSDLVIPTDGKNHYTVKAGTWDKGGGTWSIWPVPTVKTYVDISITVTANAPASIKWANAGDKLADATEYVAMTAGENNTYTYTLAQVDEAKGVDYTIKVGDIVSTTKNTSKNVTVDFKNLLPQVAIEGIDGKWDSSNKMTVSDDYLTASITLPLAAKDHAWKLTIDAAWLGGSKFVITRTNNSVVVKEDAGGDGKLTADIAGDYVFTWTYASQTLTVDYPVSVTATAENGTVKGAGTYTHGDTVTLTATPAEGYEFVNWTSGETVVSTENPYKFTITADVALVANFTPTLPTEIKISGEATHTEYNFGEQFDVTGLVVTAVYSDKEIDITEQVEWTMSPLTIGTTAVEVKATYGTFSATKTCNVTVHVPHNKVTSAGVLDGIFLVSDTKAVKFSTGNLQYNCGTYTWSFAEEQYEIIGGEAYDGTNNTNYGMNVPGYTGKLDLFAWSCESSKYGVNPSNTDADYTGAFVDWGTLVEETGWYTLTQAEMQYLLNQKKDGKALWTFASIEGIKGLMLMPYNWDVKLNDDIEYGYAPKDFSAEFEHNVFTADEWNGFQGSGAAFLPTAGSRTGGYGNTENAGASNEYDENGHYFHVDNVNDYGYYWLNTEDSRDGYQHCASYLIFPGWSDNELKDDESDDFNYGPTIWSREKRRGNSVRLVKETTRPADAPTDILNLETGIAPQKIFMNGQLIIIKNGVQYNAQGQVVK